MSSSNAIDFNYSAFNLFEQQKKSRVVAGFLFVVVMLLHMATALYLLSASKSEHKKPPVVMEVVMLPQPEPIEKHVAKEPPPAPRPAKKEPVKPKPIIKPVQPIKKPVAVKKSAPAPKPQPAETKEVIPVPKFEPVPKLIPAPPPVAAQPPLVKPSASSNLNDTAKPKETTGHGRDDSKTIVSGVVPLVRVPPKYPARAASRHIEGWVKIEFTIQTDGSVDNAVVVGSEPVDIFDDAALTAISKWKFKEKVVNGVAVPQRAVQKLQFKLEH